MLSAITLYKYTYFDNAKWTESVEFPRTPAGIFCSKLNIQFHDTVYTCRILWLICQTAYIRAL